VGRISEYSREAREVTIDAETFAPDLRQNPENRFVGNVVADEDRHSTVERRMRHQLSDAFAFVDPRPQDFNHRLAH